MKCRLQRAFSKSVRVPEDPAVTSGEEGFTLVEVLLAVIILGLAIVALLGGLFTSLFGSNLHRSQSDLDAALVRAEEAIKAAPYQPCSGTNPTGTPYTSSSGYTAVTVGNGTSYAATANPATPPAGQGYFTISVSYWNGGAFVAATSLSGCYPAVPPTDNQLVQVTGYSPDHQAAQVVSVVKGQWGP